MDVKSMLSKEERNTLFDALKREGRGDESSKRIHTYIGICQSERSSNFMH